MSSMKVEVNKTRNAILRMKKCSPKLRTILRERCQERIQKNRLKILDSLRKTKIQDSFRLAFGSILTEEWKNIEDDEISELCPGDLLPDLSPEEFNLEEELLLEELLEKELLCEHEDWLAQQYEELLNEELNYSDDDVVCPLCCLGFFEIKEFPSYKKAICTKCSASFIIEKSELDLKVVIYECLAWHDKQCNVNPSFVNIPKNEVENNLCLVCDCCSFFNVVI